VPAAAYYLDATVALIVVPGEPPVVSSVFKHIKLLQDL